MTFKGKIESNKLLDIFENFGQYIDESKIKIANDGLYATMSDRAIVCVCDFKISSQEFESYELEKEMEIGLNITYFLSILKRKGKSKFIILEIDEKKLTIKFDGRKFDLRQLDIEESEKVPLDSLDKFTSTVELKTDVFLTAIKDCSIIADNMDIKTDENKLTFFASDTGSSETSVYKGMEVLYHLEGKGNGKYPLDYLTKLKPKTEKIELKFGVDYPMIISFGNFKFCLAPRVAE